jgi:hypothetical protein
MMRITLVSESKPIYAWQIASGILGTFGIIIIAQAIYTTRKKRGVEPNPKIDGKIEPVRHRSTSSHRPKKSSASSPETYKRRPYVYRHQPTVEFRTPSDPIHSNNYNVPNPNCPLCHGMGTILTKVGPLPCPFCDLSR